MIKHQWGCPEGPACLSLKSPLAFNESTQPQANMPEQAPATSLEPSLPVFVGDDGWLAFLPTHLALIISTRKHSDANDLKTKWLQGIFLGGWKCSVSWWGNAFQGCMLLSKFIKGYTENVVILLYVNYTLMGIFKIIKQLEFRKKTSGCNVNDPI